MPHASTTTSPPWWKSQIFQIPFATILAIIVGVIINRTASSVPKEALQIVQLPGTLWLNALRAVVLPLILISMITSMQELKRIPSGGGSRVAKVGLSYYLITTFAACVEGVVFVYLIMFPLLKPIPEDELLKKFPTFATASTDLDLKTQTITDRITGIFLSLVPVNVVGAMAQNDLLGVIITGIVIGGLLKDGGPDNPSIVLKMCAELERIVVVVIKFLIKLAGVGIFSLLLPVVMGADLAELMRYAGIYLGTLYAALAFHLLIIYPTLFLLFIRRNPLPFLRSMLPCFLTALGTSSSAATMPVTIDCVHKAGIKPEVYKFMIPLGTTISMDGAAIGFPIAIAFMALGVGRTLTVVDMIVISIT
ncbi:hypothetical protein HK102_008095, partial [Quaeritorhiza haematococci]